MSLVELIAQADARALAVSGLACLDRCVPLLGGGEDGDEVLRPLWGSVAEGDEWGGRLAKVRAALGAGVPIPVSVSGPVSVSVSGPVSGEGDAVFGDGDGDGDAMFGAGDGDAVFGDGDAPALVRRMLDAAPDRLPGADDTGPLAGSLRAWADACSVAALQIHRILDIPGTEPASVTARREGRTEGMSPLVAAELRRQIAILELLAERGTGGLRQVLEMSTEGRRVLRAVVSRRARGRG
ncbi:hypothetical protein ACFVT5_02105 [Streptomyces sp. NPDC058001]|uniref:hypothetical protein n=1 Tax=Streptomyces sp. NPDC058001 TaxID=3346300 RepID=UPI0036E054C8